MKFSILPQSLGSLKLLLNLFSRIDIQGRELYICDFAKYALNMGLCLGVYEPFSFKLGMMIHTNKLYILIQF